MWIEKEFCTFSLTGFLVSFQSLFSRYWDLLGHYQRKSLLTHYLTYYRQAFTVQDQNKVEQTFDAVLTLGILCSLAFNISSICLGFFYWWVRLCGTLARAVLGPGLRLLLKLGFGPYTTFLHHLLRLWSTAKIRVCTFSLCSTCKSIGAAFSLSRTSHLVMSKCCHA